MRTLIGVGTPRGLHLGTRRRLVDTRCRFLGLDLDEAPPEHSTISRTRRLIDLETHRAVFTWILQVLATADLVKGKTIGIDATTLEANAALRSIVRRDSGETYQEFLTRLAQASGIETPTRADLARLDRKRPKKGRDWRHPHDPDARITKMKDGRTHLAHKAEHAVDLETGAIVGDGPGCRSRRHDDDRRDGDRRGGGTRGGGGRDGRTDGGDRRGGGRQGVSQQSGAGGTYIAEPNRGRRNWKKKTVARDAVYANRRRIRGARGLALQRRRSEHLGELGAEQRAALFPHRSVWAEAKKVIGRARQGAENVSA